MTMTRKEKDDTAELREGIAALKAENKRLRAAKSDDAPDVEALRQRHLENEWRKARGLLPA